MLKEIYGEFPAHSTKVENPQLEYPLFGFVLQYLGNLESGKRESVSEKYKIEIFTQNGEHTLTFLDKVHNKHCVQVKVLLGGMVFWKRVKDKEVTWIDAFEDLSKILEVPHNL